MKHLLTLLLLATSLHGTDYVGLHLDANNDPTPFLAGEQVKLPAASGGFFTTLAPAAGASYTATFPAVTGTLAALNLAQSWSALNTYTDATWKMTGSAGATKTLLFELDGMSAGADLVLNSGAQTGDFTITLPVVAGADTLVSLATASPFTGLVSVTNSGALIHRQASTQDGIGLLGRAGGSSSYTATLTPLTLGASRTYSLSDADQVLAGSASALTSGRVPRATAGGLLTDEAFFWNSGTNLVVSATQTAQVYHSSITPTVQINGLSNATATLAQSRWTADASGPILIFAKSRGAGVGTQGTLSDSDILGQLSFDASDGVALFQAAQIRAAADGASSAGATPAKLIFSTAPAGSTSVATVLTLAADKTATFTGNIVQSGATTLSTGTGAVSLNGTTTIAADASVSYSPTGAATLSAVHGAAGTGNFARVRAKADSAPILSMDAFSSTYTGTAWGITLANYQTLSTSSSTSNGLIIGHTADKPVIFGVGTGEVARFTGQTLTTQSFAIKYTTDATSTTTGSITTLGGGSHGVTKSWYGGGFFSPSPTIGMGYATGAGGTVTQGTSRTTGVTLDKVCGQITLVSAAGSATWQSFTLTNSAIAAGDTVRVVQKSGTDLYLIHVTAVAAGSCQITYATTGGTTTEQPVFTFSVLKGVSS